MGTCGTVGPVIGDHWYHSMPNQRLFLKVYVSQGMHDDVHELARLKGWSAAAVVRDVLEEADLQTRLREAMSQEAMRLRLLQQQAEAAAGQTDWLHNGKEAAPGHKAKRSAAGARARDRETGVKARGKRQGTRKRAARR